MVCVVPMTGVPDGLVDHEYASYPFPALNSTLAPHKITSSSNVQLISAKKFVAAGVNKHPVLLLKLGSSEIVNNGFNVPL